VRKSFLLIAVFILGCSKKENIRQDDVAYIDKGISIYQDTVPNNDVMMQAFWWDSFSDSKTSNYKSFYAFLSEQVISLSNAHIDLLWLPPVSEGEGMGYHPRKLFDFNSFHGSKLELEQLLELVKSRKMHAMADLVFNHRVGTSTWTDFTEPAWSCESICINDEGFTNPNAFGTEPCGDLDEGEGWGGARDLNHKSIEVQQGLKDYLLRLKSLGFDSWRYDFVKGFPAKYIAEYNQSTDYYYSVGEYFDGNVTALKSWIDQTNTSVSDQITKKSAAFDFALKYKLKEAFIDKNFEVLKENHAISGFENYGENSVTFLDNHDTGCINRNDCDNIFSNNIIEINKGYAYLLTHPGIPMIWIYHYLFSDSTGALKKNIEELIVIRKSNNIHANSKVEVLETVNGSNGYYLSIVDDTLLIKIGDGNYQADEQWRVLKSEKGYTIWSK
jgi:hypothetical protein